MFKFILVNSFIVYDEKSRLCIVFFLILFLSHQMLLSAMHIIFIEENPKPNS